MTDNREAVTLLPCPFCGDTEEVETRYQDKAWRVHCGACGGCAYGWETERQAIATWNTRQQTSVPDVEQLNTSSATCKQNAVSIPDGDVVERVAKALVKATLDHGVNDDTIICSEDAEHLARAAIEALNGAGVK